MAAGGYDFDGFDADSHSELESFSPVIPLQNTFQRRSTDAEDGDRSSMRSRRVNRALFPDSSDSESETTTQLCPRKEVEREDDRNQSLLLEMKQMLSEVCKKVDKNEHVLKELQNKINSG